MTENDIGTIVVDSAIRLHRETGPGLLESVYEVLLAHELESAGLEIRRQVSIPIKYNHIIFDEGFRGHNAGNQSGKGHGLAFIRQVIEIHGGRVSYEKVAGGNNRINFGDVANA